MNLFSSATPGAHEPLAARMRPRSLDEYIGQDHIIGEGRLLRRAIQADQLTSVIFYGPPGTGKTTLARVIAHHTKSNFVTLNAVLAGVQQIRDAIAAAEEQRSLYERKTILFVDEVHRWNRAQQDALLPWVENGTIILIGATTENPFFEVNKALVSRSRVFQLKALTSADLARVAQFALTDKERGYGRWNVSFAPDALEHLVQTASGDARSLLNALELAIESSVPSWPPADGTAIAIDRDTAEESIQQRIVLYDRDGDYHYDVISAFIKSLRGRDPDAALYWMARMLVAGEDPHFIFRRMLISAAEDTGLADPMAIVVVESCAAAFDRIGLPEGRFHLTQAALYLATAPKSNSTLAFFDAIASVEGDDAEVPNHLKDGNRDKEGFGHGEGYMYPHAYRDHWAAQQYLPSSLVGRVFYTPSKQGHEGAIRQEVLTRRELQIAAILEEKDESRAEGEMLTFSPGNSKRNQWVKRLDSGTSESLLRIREALFDNCALARHHRILVWGADDGLLIWEASRRAPEGFVAGLCRREQALGELEQYARTLDELDRPQLAVLDADGSLSANPFTTPFDRIIARDPALTIEGILAFVLACQILLGEGGKIRFSVRQPARGMRISRLATDSTLIKAVGDAEERFFTDPAHKRFSWTDKELTGQLQKKGFTVNNEEIENTELRRPSTQDLERWFDPSRSTYARYLVEHLGEDTMQRFTGEILERCLKEAVPWNYTIVLYTVSL